MRSTICSDFCGERDRATTCPINKIADYAITGDVNEIIPKMIKYYKQNSK